MGQKKNKNKIWLIGAVVFLIAAIMALVILIVQFVSRKKAGGVYDGMAESVNKVTEDMASEDTTAGIEAADELKKAFLSEQQETEEAEENSRPYVEIPEKEIDWEALHAQNEDIYAWIYVPDTNIDYPIVQHPSDNNYYLDHNLDGSKGYPGCIYSEDYNKRDFSDVHTVLYGHNLKDKTMFSALHDFADRDFFDGDHYIFIYTKDTDYAYQIFAAYEYPGIHLLDNFDFANEYVFEEYLNDISESNARVANRKEDVPVLAQDKILTLSTCTTDHDSNWRFLVTGVLTECRTTIID